MQRSTTPWYLFNSFTKEIDCIDVVLGHSQSEVTCEGLSKEKALFDYWDRSWIQGFGNAHNIRIIAKLGGVTYCAKPLKRPKNMRKNRTALEKLGQIVRLDGIWLNGLT